MIRTTAAVDDAAMRQALYAGEVFLLSGNQTTQALVGAVDALLQESFGPRPREAQFTLSNEELFRRIGQLRRALYLEPRFHAAVQAVLTAYGFPVASTAFDPLRLRVVAHEGDKNPQAAPVYYAHRDTWYAHPQCQLTFWIAMHDVSPEETFLFYPDFFNAEVPNNSEIFNYDDWVRDGWDLKIGWQRKGADTASLYPGVTRHVEPATKVGFAARAGDLLIFSGQHFHQTRPNRSGRTRFSLDFRSADLNDAAAGRGAPNADNRSRGSVLRDYVRPSAAVT